MNQKLPTFREPGVAPPEAPTSSLRLNGGEWRAAIDQMLAWMSSTDIPADDRPDNDVFETVIDYAVDQGDAGVVSAPDSIVLSGSGRIAMEWNDGAVTVVLEFLSLGVATYTEFSNSNLSCRHNLIRNPKSRQLELQE